MLDSRDESLTGFVQQSRLDAALDRAEAFLDAGAEVLFVEALEDEEQIGAVAQKFAGRVPLVLNQVEGGRTPLLELEEAGRLGIGVMLVPGGLLRAVAPLMEAYFASLRSTGSNAAFRDRMLDFTRLNELLGTQAELERSDGYLEQQKKSGRKP